MLLAWLAGCPVHRYPDGTGIEGQLEREVIALTQHVRRLEGELETCGAPDQGPNALYLELRQVFTGSDVSVEHVGSVTVLAIRGSLLFSDPYKLQLRAEARPTLDLLATALKLHPEQDVLVMGHTNDRPIPRAWSRAYPSHLDLSARMASAVVAELVDDFDCDPARLGIAGRGAHAPKQSNDLDTGRDANQRIEVWLSPSPPASSPPG